YGFEKDRVLAFAWTRAPLVESSFGFRQGLRATAGVGYARFGTSFGFEIDGGLFHQHRGSFPGGAFHSLSAEHTDVFVSAGVSFLRDSIVPLEVSLMLPLTVGVAEAHAYHTAAALSLTAHVGF